MTKFADLAKLATRLSQEGHLVTQIHHSADDAPSEWSYGDYGTHLVKGDADQVITSDGRRFAADGSEIAREASE